MTDKTLKGYVDPISKDDLLDEYAARIAELEAVIDEAIEYVAGHDDEWPKALSARLRAARAALGKKNDKA